MVTFQISHIFFDIYKYLGYWMPMNPAQMNEILSTYTIAFFDVHLNGMSSDVLMENYEVFPEVRFSKKN